VDIFDDLADECTRLDGLLAGLSEADWERASAAPGWSNVDVVLHLAQCEEAVVGTLTATAPDGAPAAERTAVSMDEAMDGWVAAERAGADLVYPRWQAAWPAALAALRTADPDRATPWAAIPLRPATLATTRLAEHWAHGLDITGPLGLPYPDTARLRHIAWLGHRSLPYAFELAGLEYRPVRAELTGPAGEVWRFGPDDAGSAITGAAGAFCRVGAQRLAPADSGLTTTGPNATTALRLLRNYAA